MVFLMFGIVPAVLFCALVPVVSGMVCVTVYMAICVRQMSEVGQEYGVLWVLALTALLCGIVQMLGLRSAGRQSDNAAFLRMLRLRSGAALLLLVLQCALCCSVLVAFIYMHSMTPLLYAGLFCVNHLLWLFPLAGTLLAFVKAQEKALPNHANSPPHVSVRRAVLTF